jgi:hypothetical protein
VKPGRYNYRLTQGDTFQNTPVWKINSVPVNITGYTARMQIRRSISSTDKLIELSTENGRITVDGVNGMFTLYISPADTAALPSGTWVYDFETFAPNGTTTTLLEGAFVIDPQVSR